MRVRCPRLMQRGRGAYQILSGWPSPTDSEVNKNVFCRVVRPGYGGVQLRSETRTLLGSSPLPLVVVPFMIARGGGVLDGG
jgi:hypothetical protein